MRDFATELRETETSDGLRIALENLMRISVPSEVDSEVDSEVVFEGEEEHLPDYVRDQLYMVLREGVRNAVAHSGSDRIEVEVRITPREVRARVRDRGTGLEPEDHTTEDLGLNSMQERISLLGGTFELFREPRSVARAEVSLPLMREKDR